jgi:hypothetical protein
MPRLRPEVILPIRPAGTWARSVLLTCCTFIMFATAVDAMRWSRGRQESRTAERLEVVRCGATRSARKAHPQDDAFRARQREIRARLLRRD